MLVLTVKESTSDEDGYVEIIDRESGNKCRVYLIEIRDKKARFGFDDPKGKFTYLRDKLSK